MTKVNWVVELMEQLIKMTTYNRQLGSLWQVRGVGEVLSSLLTTLLVLHKISCHCRELELH